MKFVLHRTRTIASVMGISIAFEKGVATHVPPHMYSEVIAAGAVPEEELGDDELKNEKVNGPADADERKLALFDVFEKVVLRNVREEFTAGGAPHSAVLTKELGWAVAAKERDAAWQEYRAGQTD